MDALEYPQARRGDVVDDYHGTDIADPYRWLEDTDAPETRAWIEAQNELTQSWLDDVDGRDVLRDHVRARWDHARRGAPWRRGGRWFQTRNPGLFDQDVLYVMDRPEGSDADRVLLDPNGLSEDGTVALTAAVPNDDGSLLAYATSEAGSDWMTWRVRDVETGEDLDDVVEWSKFTIAAWHPDGRGFWYGWYEPPADDETYEARNEHQKLRFHRLGTDQAQDPVVLERPDEPGWGFDPSVTHDDRYLVVSIWEGTHPEDRLYYRELDDDATSAAARFVPLLDEADASYVVVGIDGDVWYVLTDRDAPRKRIVAIDLRDPEPDAWREIVAESDDAIEDALLVGGRLVIATLHDATHRLEVCDLDGAPQHSIDLPDLGTVGEGHETVLHGRQEDTAVTFGFQTFTRPSTPYLHDVTTAETRALAPPSFGDVGGDVGGDVVGDADGGADSGFVTEQVFVTSADGTRVPMFLVHRADVEPNGELPTILWGYGGFDIAVTPTFKVPWLVWVEQGGLLAVANLRGGGEYGREWHDAGRLANKQNVFDDFIACAEWLDASEWTSREHVGIEGRSNGGLLVGACMTQRPDLFAACVPEVGVLDMLRFHRFTIGWGWVSDFGSADDLEQFEWLHAYSPLHNVRDGVCYPPTLVTTGDHDDRVVPGHSFKFVARLQEAQPSGACRAPILARIDTSAGHGVGKPVSKLVDERADVLAFHAENLALSPTPPEEALHGQSGG